ncbi:MAG: 2-keto-4-pentenoate hydratase [Desulfovibrio sp.]|jgi:2-keto-4-pentenoate hydratase|nr:2-keto-4-pentenoate hydratase [Desulfovibrio sp.]
MDKKTVSALAQNMRNAELNRKAVGALTAAYPDLSIADAYMVQRAAVEERIRSGGTVIGKKVGLTSNAMQLALGVSEPDFGHLFADMLFDEEIPVPVSRFLQPRIEAEIAFVLGEDMKGPGVSIADVLRTTVSVVPSFEIIDSRIADWKIKIQDTIADNGSSAGFVLGSKLVPIGSVDLKYVGLVLQKNGSIIETAAGAAVMGHPARAVAWLANALAGMDVGLKRGEIVLSGSFTKAFDVAAGDVFTASFGGLGSVKVVFV